MILLAVTYGLCWASAGYGRMDTLHPCPSHEHPGKHTARCSSENAAKDPSPIIYPVLERIMLFQIMQKFTVELTHE